MGKAESPFQWILLIYRVPQNPPGRRTYVWRQLKQLGAVYLQQAAAILPDTPALREAVERLVMRIEETDGEVSLLLTSSPSSAWEDALIERFNRARDEEYAEVVENVERLEDEIRRESGKGKFTFAELEELESDWDKIQRWFERIGTRDVFTAPAQQCAAAAMKAARTLLDDFTATVYAREDNQGQVTT